MNDDEIYPEYMFFKGDQKRLKELVIRLEKEDMYDINYAELQLSAALHEYLRSIYSWREARGIKQPKRKLYNPKWRQRNYRQWCYINKKYHKDS